MILPRRATFAAREHSPVARIRGPAAADKASPTRRRRAAAEGVAPSLRPTSQPCSLPVTWEQLTAPPPPPFTQPWPGARGPTGGSLRGTISLEGIPNLPGYRSTPMRPQKHRQTLQIRHGSMVVIGHRDPLPGSPGSTVRLDRSISRGLRTQRPARSFGDFTGRYSPSQQKDALAAEEGKGRLPFPKGQPLPKWLQYGKEQLTFKARSRRVVSRDFVAIDSCAIVTSMGRFFFEFRGNSAQAYFEEAVPGCKLRAKRVRKCMLYYYLEDDCLQIFEPCEENSGLPQGLSVRRHRVPKPDGSYYGMSDLQIGAIIDVYRKMIHIHDCDDFTRKTLTERGLPVRNRLVASGVRRHQHRDRESMLAQLQAAPRLTTTAHCGHEARPRTPSSLNDRNQTANYSDDELPSYQRGASALRNVPMILECPTGPDAHEAGGERPRPVHVSEEK